MKTSTKVKTFLIVIFVAIFTIIAARHFIGLHFKKKFSVRPAPGVIVTAVKKSNFYKSIETFGTAIAQNSKTYRVNDLPASSERLTVEAIGLKEVWVNGKNKNSYKAGRVLRSFLV